MEKAERPSGLSNVKSPNVTATNSSKLFITEAEELQLEASKNFPKHHFMAEIEGFEKRK